MKELI
ncbi:hypothetical protein V3C99_015072, partial [Haemonchus contortus]|jgi:hypothetical protein